MVTSPSFPAGLGEFGGDAVQQGTGVARPRVALGGVQLSPRVGRGDVDGGALPDGAFRAREPSDVEAIQSSWTFSPG